MANGSIISEGKYAIMKLLIEDPLIVKVINAHDVIEPDELIHKRIFSWHQNPVTLKEGMTFITIQISRPLVYSNFDKGSKGVAPYNMEIWIISHESHMIIDNIPKVIGNRNDYLSHLIDKKLNGSTFMGLGKMRLVSNIETPMQENWLGRQLLFTTNALDNAVCDEDNY